MRYTLQSISVGLSGCLQPPTRCVLGYGHRFLFNSKINSRKLLNQNNILIKVRLSLFYSIEKKSYCRCTIKGCAKCRQGFTWYMTRVEVSTPSQGSRGHGVVRRGGVGSQEATEQRGVVRLRASKSTPLPEPARCPPPHRSYSTSLVTALTSNFTLSN